MASPGEAMDRATPVGSRPWSEEIRPERQRVALAVCVTLHVVLALLVFEPTLFAGADAGHYMVLGESLGSGQGYRDLHLPGSPLHAKYPPGFPALLAVLGWVGGLQVFKASSLVLSAGAVTLTFFLGRRLVGPHLALAGAGLLAVSPVLLQFSHLVLSEALFTFLVLLALLASEGGRRTWTVLAIGAAAFFTRTAGLALLLALVLVMAVERQPRRAVAAALVAAVCIGGWGLYQQLASPTQPGYMEQLLLVNPYIPGGGRIGVSEIPVRVAGNFWQYVSRELPGSLGLPRGTRQDVPPGTVLAGIILSSLVLVGWLRGSAQRFTTSGLLTLLYVGMIVLWPTVWTDRRFLLPILPLLLLYALDGFRSLSAKRLPALAHAAAWGLALAAALPAVAAAVRIAPERLGCQSAYRMGTPCDRPEYASFYQAARWAAEHTPAGAVVANRSPATFYLFSGRQGDLYRYSRDAALVLRGLEEMGADYVVVDRLSLTTALYLVPALEVYPDRFELVYTAGDPPTLIFRMLPAPSTARLSGSHAE